MSKVIVTNTTKRPIVIRGRLVHIGASVECEEHEVPEALSDQLTAAQLTVSAESESTPISAEGSIPEPTAEELLVAAVKGKKP